MPDVANVSEHACLLLTSSWGSILHGRGQRTKEMERGDGKYVPLVICYGRDIVLFINIVLISVYLYSAA